MEIQDSENEGSSFGGQKVASVVKQSSVSEVSEVFIVKLKQSVPSSVQIYDRKSVCM